MADVCEAHHDLWGTLLTIGLIGGLVASYVPQHLKIINKGSSEGFSPWFLFLGATSSASGCLNMWTMQWGVVQCCKYINTGSCAESLGGLVQVTLQWFLFFMIVVFFIVYYPSHLKYEVVTVDTLESEGITHVKTNVKTGHWYISVVLTWAIILHLLLCAIVTFSLVLSTKADLPAGPATDPRVAAWATFLGLTSAALAAIQYCPQLLHTYQLKLVGALSIPMMVIQSPGAALMVISIAMRPGTDWTSWIMFAVSGVMQAILLIMCIAWKIRQRRLNIDDFGHPLYPTSEDSDPSHTNVHGSSQESEHGEEQAPLTTEELAQAIIDERAPLLRNDSRAGSTKRKLSSLLRAVRK